MSDPLVSHGSNNSMSGVAHAAPKILKVNTNKVYHSLQNIAKEAPGQNFMEFITFIEQEACQSREMAHLGKGTCYQVW